MTTLDKIRAEIEQRYDDCEEDWETGEQYGYWNCLKILDKYAEQEPTERCKNCKYFEYDSVANVDGIPLIVAHEICSRWGDGCKTSENGFCFMFEKGGE